MTRSEVCLGLLPPSSSLYPGFYTRSPGAPENKARRIQVDSECLKIFCERFRVTLAARQACLSLDLRACRKQYSSGFVLGHKIHNHSDL